MDERSLMNSFFEDILKTSSVDYSCNEIEDIQTAVLEMMERIAVKINERGLFNISRIEPCGSMAEKAALWKTNDMNIANGTISEKYLEFDFLAVLVKTDDIKLPMHDCKVCKEVNGSLMNIRLLNKYGYTEMLTNGALKDESINDPRITELLFRRELRASFVSFCNCLAISRDRPHDLLHGISFTRKFDHLSVGCTECSIRKASGTLVIALGSPYETIRLHDSINYTLLLYWESMSSSLFAPVGYNINKTQNMKCFRIHIDFIAALETLQETHQGDKQTVDPNSFIVSKRCHVCYKKDMWRLSDCIEEMKAIKNEFSMKHKKCYMILKYILQTAVINNYIMKTVVLNHHTTCTDTSEDMVACVKIILQELSDALGGLYVEVRCRPATLLCKSTKPTGRYTFKSRILDSIDVLDSFKPYRRAFEDLALKDIRT